MPAPKKVLKLIERFERNRDAYRSHEYNETQARREFIDPLFKALGWDVTNEKGYAEGYKEVIHEDAIKVGGATKAPDYCFRIGGTRRFFVEAKRPSVGIKDDPIPAYQLRRYAWSAKLPLSILTDFEEFAVYDCRVKPSKTDKASAARILYITYTEYAERWDEIASIFSQEAILTGSFDRYVESTKRKRGTAEVDDAFLKEIENWRDVLARNIALRNTDLSTRELNFAVQRTIDRIIFLRICEDRGIEEYGQLMALENGTQTYKRMCQILCRADERYNSGLFHFRKEKDRPEPPDGLTLSLTVDDKVLKEVFKDLYYPDSPYEFSVLPADILGHIYEQFLGKVIRLTPAHRAVVEDKPEVKKAGGVYYTPTYIVDYIVKHTVGKLLEGKTPQQVRTLYVLDPACGSGSFLLGAYQRLLDWHLEWYSEHNPEKHAKGRSPRIFHGPGGDWRLTTAERKRILTNNIYGVDIDPQAVEVTKLSLLLKVLEGENAETLGKSLRLFHERALPDLADNIKCGNSLIGPDFYEGKQLSLIDKEERYRINAFDWNAEFPEIMSAGGFDAVIGNPPYIFTRDQGIGEDEKRYYYDCYSHQSAQLNTFALFLERSLSILHPSGLSGFITPNNWLTIQTFAPLRQFVAQSSKLIRVVNILERVFSSANVDTAITIIEKGDPETIEVSEMVNGKITFLASASTHELRPPEYIIQVGLFRDPLERSVIEKIESGSKQLSTFCKVSTGLKAYQTGKGKPAQTDEQKKRRVYHSRSKLDETYGWYLQGADVVRYHLSWSGEFLSYGNWLAEPRRSVPFEGERILVRQIPAQPPYLIHAVYTDQPFYHDINSMVLFAPRTPISLKCLLGLLNSRTLSFWFLRRFEKLQRKTFPQFKVRELAAFPIKDLDLASSSDKARHDRMVELVDAMLKLHNDLQVAKTDHEKSLIHRQIDTTNKQIDQLVYELYGLTDEEIRIVEKATK